jgi:hypothetical protein
MGYIDKRASGRESLGLCGKSILVYKMRSEVRLLCLEPAVKR